MDYHQRDYRISLSLKELELRSGSCGVLGSAVLGLRGGGAALRLSRTGLACGVDVEIMVRTCGRGRLLGVLCVRTLQFSRVLGVFLMERCWGVVYSF